MRVLVMGGTRLMGEATVRHLLDAGHEVVVFHRGSRTPAWVGRVTTLLGDRDVPEQLAPVRSSGADAVVDFSAYRGAQSEALVEVLPEGAHLVHCSTGAVYRPVPSLPWDEDSPLGPWDLWGDYATEKLATERAVERAEGHPVTVFRLPYVLGPRNYAPREEFVLNRLLDGVVVGVPGDGKAVQQAVTAEQVAQSVVRMVERTAPVGVTVLNVADPRAVFTTEGFVQICAEVAGVEPRTTPVPGPTGAEGPFDAANCVFPFPNEAYLLDLDRARDAGVLPDPRPVAQAVDTALQALLTDPERRRWQRTAAERRALGDLA